MHADRRAAAWTVALALLLSVPSGSSGSADDPEVTDPAGDVVVSGGGPLQPILDTAGMEEAFDDVDLLAGWVTEVDDDAFNVTVRAAAPVQDDTQTIVSFTVRTTTTSVHGSTAGNGTTTQIALAGTTVTDGPDNVTAVAEGDDLIVTIPRDAAGVFGGDELVNLSVERSRSTDDLAPLVAPGQDAEDHMPDEGAAPSQPFAFSRPPVQAGVLLTFVGGTITENGTSRAFSTPGVTTGDPDALLSVDVEVRNSGTDEDTVSLFAAASGSRASATVTPSSVTLPPGEAATVQVTVALDDASQALAYTLRATSDLGAEANLSGLVTVVDGTQPPPPDTDGDDADRTPIPAGLGWLTPSAEGLGLDGLLGKFAELALLALIVLVVLLLVAIAYALLGRRGKEEAFPDGQAADPATGEEPLIEADAAPAPVPVAGLPGLLLRSVATEPAPPAPGEAATTVALIENTGRSGVRVRARLHVDGKPLQEQLIAVPARHRVRVRFPWKAGPGGNDAKVQVEPA